MYLPDISSPKIDARENSAGHKRIWLQYDYLICTYPTTACAHCDLASALYYFYFDWTLELVEP